MTRALRWLRKVPLVGWLALGLALAVALWRRQARIAAAAQVAAQASRMAWESRVALQDAMERAHEVTRARKDALVADHGARVTALAEAERALTAAKGARLTDEINAYFAGAP